MAVSKVILDLLIEHIDGPLPMMIPCKAMDESIGERDNKHQRRRTIFRAVQSKLLAYIDRGHPTKTTLTEQGRTIMCEALADMAETLLRAKFSPDFQPPAGLALPSVSPDSEQFQLKPE